MPSPEPRRSRPAENHRTASSGLGGQTLNTDFTPATDNGRDAAPLTADAAERLTQRIRLRLDAIADNAEAVVPMIEQAKAGDVHKALGHPSWTAYVSERFGGTLGRLDRSERQPLVLLLAEQGMSTRAIGSVVGVGKSTVDRDLAGVPDGTPGAVTGTDNLVVETTDNLVVTATPTNNVVGIDGKSYPRAKPSKPRRRPLPDSYRDAAYKLKTAVETLARLHADDRFLPNRETLEQRHGSDAARAATLVQSIVGDLAGTLRCQYCHRRIAVTSSCCDQCGVCR